jgi:Domain of unknown function (DUF4136)
MTWKQPLCVFLLVLSACASPKIGYDYDPGANFSTYHKYEWIERNQEKTGDRRVDNSQLDIRIRTAVGAQLHVKGYTAANDQPDFYVAYSAVLNDMTPDVSTQYYSQGMAGGPFVLSVDTRSPNGPTTGAITPANDSPSYLTGTLLIDIVDAASKKLVWRGTAAGAVDPGLTSQQRDERIRTIVREMLSHFPPK